MVVLKRLALGIAVLVAVLAGIGFVLPRTAHVERSAPIHARPATVFAVLNGFKRFNDWSPWFEMDPNAVTTYEGPASGVGARMNWAGNEAVGSGSQEIVESVPSSRIRIKLVFGGWDTAQTATYTLEPQGDGTYLTWAYDTDLGGNVVARYLGLVMDGMMGGDLERGLTRLNGFVEALPKGDLSGLNAEFVEVAAQTLAYVSGTTTTDADAIGTAHAVAMSKVVAFMQANNLASAGAPLSVARRWDEQARIYEYDAGIPVDRGEVAASEVGEVKLGTTYSGKAVRAAHKGPYRTLGQTYAALDVFLQVGGYERNGNPWEQYVADPATTPPSELVTYVYFPVK